MGLKHLTAEFLKFKLLKPVRFSQGLEQGTSYSLAHFETHTELPNVVGKPKVTTLGKS